ncbi:MAG: alpha/beta fold hydrolase [archaeon]
MKTQFISNSIGQRIAVVVEKPKLDDNDPIGLAIIMHGLGGFKEQPHITAFAKAFLEEGYIALRFDSINSLGESAGKYEDATVTSYYSDLETVIRWARDQTWFIEPFCLIGHSLGGLCAALYAEKHPEEVKALAPISTVVSGKLSIEAHDKEELEDWKKTGWQIRPSASKPGVIKKLKWSHMEDRLRYDLLLGVGKLTMPVLLMVGEHDETTPLKHQKILFDALPGKKDIHTIKGASHTFKDKSEVEEIRIIMTRWIRTL